MKKLISLSKIKSLFIILAIISFAFFNSSLTMVVQAETPQQRLEKLQKELDRVKSEKASLQKQLDSNTYTIAGYNTQVSKLQGEAALYQKDIDELNIEIEQLELSIDILNKQIEEKLKEIERAEKTVADLDQESSLRINNSYMNYRMYGKSDGGSTMFVIDNINSYFKDSQYKELIQSETNEMLAKLAILKQELSEKKKELDQKLIEVKKEKEIIDIKKSDLDKKKEDVQVKLAAYYAEVNKLQSTINQNKQQLNTISDAEMKLSAKAELIKQEIMMTTINSGQFVLAGTIIGFQGCTGYCFGEHLHYSVYYNGVAVNPCGQLQPGVGCGSSGNPLKPPLRGSVSFNSGFGWRAFDNAFHDGIDITGLPYGAPVYASHDGYVQRGLDCWHRNQGYRINGKLVGCANYVRIAQNKGSNAGFKTGYWHLK